MGYVIGIILIVISYFVGKSKGEAEGYGEAEDRYYYLSEPQIDLFEKGYKKGVKDTKDKLAYWLK